MAQFSQLGAARVNLGRRFYLKPDLGAFIISDRPVEVDGLDQASDKAGQGSRAPRAKEPDHTACSVWRGRPSDQLMPEDERIIKESLVGLFRVLAEWDSKERLGDSETEPGPKTVRVRET